MATFDVTVSRTGYSVRTITVEANTEDEAYAAALENAGGECFSEHASKYEVESVLQSA